MDASHKWNTSFTPLVIGFILSLLLTFGTYHFAMTVGLTGMHLILSVLGLVIIQAVLQLIFFMNLCCEAKPRWNLLIFFFTVIVMIVLVSGSIWIMKNLDYNVMIDM